MMRKNSLRFTVRKSRKPVFERAACLLGPAGSGVSSETVRREAFRRASFPGVCLATALVFVFSTIIAVGELGAGPDVPSVLILNSYHQGEAWSDNEISGVLSVLRARYPNLVPYIEHLDAKRFRSPDDLDRMERRLSEKYRDHSPDLVMVLDNPAFDLMLQHGSELFPDVPVVFAGVNGFRPEMIAGRANITGVAEREDMAGTLQMAMRMHPGVRTVFAVHDHTASGLAVRGEMEKVLPQFDGKVEVVYSSDDSLEGLTRELKAMPSDGVVMILTYVTDRTGRTYTREESTRLISSLSPVPVYAMHETRLGYGIVGGMLLEGQEHGKQAGGLALRVLAGEAPSRIAVEPSVSHPVLDYRVLSRFDIPESAWPPEAKVINRPVSIWGKHGNVLAPTLVVIMVLAGLSVLLGTVIGRMRGAEKALRENEEKYRILVEHAGEAIYVAQDGRLKFVNANAEEITGYSREELLSTPFVEFIHPDDVASVLDRHRKRLEGAELPSRYAFRILHHSGGTRWVETNVVSIQWQGKAATLNFLSDITERRKAEEALRERESEVRKKLQAILEPEGDIGSLRLADIIDSRSLRTIMEDFHRLTDISSALLDVSGEVLVAVGWQDICKNFHRIHPDSCRNCLESDTVLSRGVSAGTFKAYRCKNNLWDMVTPIEVGGRHVGNMFLGQFFYEDETSDVETFRSQAREYGFDEEEYIAAFQRVPRWSREKVETAISFYAGLAALIASLSYSRIRLSRALSERTTVLEELRKFRTIADKANYGTAIVSPEGVILYVNEAFGRLHGWDPQELLGRHLSVFHNDEQMPGARALLDHILREGGFHAEEVWHKRRDGSVFPSLMNAMLIRDASGASYISATAIDITERKQDEEQLRFQSRVLNQIRDIVTVTDLDGRVTYVNDAECRMIGLTRDQLIGRRIVIYSENPKVGRIQDMIMRETLEHGEWRGEVVNYRFDGRPILLDCRTHTVNDENGRPVALCGIGTDITETKRTERALQNHRDFLRRVIDAVPALIGVKDAQGVYSLANSALCAAYGTTKTGLEGHADSEFSPSSEEIEEFRKYDLQVVQERRILRVPEQSLTFADGSVHWLSIVKLPLVEEDGSCDRLLAVGTDITERKRAEEEREQLQAQLIQAQKMESVGRLAGGVAHDFNNMLGVILGHTELAIVQTDRAEPLFADLQEILKAARRSADLTRQLLAFARKQTISPEVLDLNETVEGMLKMLRRLIGEDIDLAWLPGKNLWPVKVDPGQIDQVLANLCVNARDAISGVGKVVIETRNVVVDDDYHSNHEAYISGGYVLLSVSDNGCGMDEETRRNLFEPFFTTKGVGKGTGLGLATVYGIVKQNNGMINVHSEPGNGAMFRIYFPRHETTSEGIRNKEETAAPATGRETILLVEDEAAMLKMVRAMLERLGYRVLSAGTPSEAIRVAETHDGDIHLLMTDVVMPEMNGKELTDRISARYPDLRSVFISGYTADAIARHGVLDEGVHFLQKPFTMRDLGATVRSVLSRTSESIRNRAEA